MDNIANLEISPGTITIQPCQSCGNNAYTFDTVALHDALPICNLVAGRACEVK